MEVTLSPCGGGDGSTRGSDLLKHARFPDEVRLTINHSDGQRSSGAFDGLAKALDLTALSNLLSERRALHSGQQTGNQAEPRAGSPSLPELITSAHREKDIKSQTFLIRHWRCRSRCELVTGCKLITFGLHT